ncbi:Hsp20/alpha crystallin family protein [Planctomyces sp. SH-PL14]|uniref:Hsp20/alpha crystallin family protein n=1 Tax=Planctomyces sp. SH-PL14 TaxID=1632864 RepID=UPI00078C749C|nr:Hsp20/alpha crystallin family protein [Planctomyces sp. SH-PL14]AMV17192.1 Spore protein SP21 [Planctomyces sp. SH-PL14]
MQDPRSDARSTPGSVERLRHEFDKWLETAWSQGERAMDAIGIRKSATPAVDVIETPDAIVVLVDIPGLAADQIELTLTGHMLTLNGKHPELESGQVHLNERPHGLFKRSIPLPSTVDADTIIADSKNGVLRITVQKIPTQKARRIEITG